ncbi:MAG: hypothetical protein ACR2OU_20180 [Thermomicrobiales bacterium]
MAKKIPASPTKPSPSDHPLKLDEIMRKNFPDGPLAERLERADDAFFSQRNDPNRSVKPTNHKTFNRQKKV